MLATQEVIESLARRIERAYLLRRRDWNPARSTTRVWAVAAARLVEAHQTSVGLPLDPELYVASQPVVGAFADPWNELTQRSSARHYRAHVRRIVRVLLEELRSEVRRAERRVARGAALEQVVLDERRSWSPLSRFIVARRGGRPDLAERFRRGALGQHGACPLYRQASLSFLTPEHYPTADPQAAALSLSLSPIRAALRPALRN